MAADFVLYRPEVGSEPEGNNKGQGMYNMDKDNTDQWEPRNTARSDRRVRDLPNGHDLPWLVH